MPKKGARLDSSTGLRLCGTPGCGKRDFHVGPCTTDEPTSKRPRYEAPPLPPPQKCPPPRRQRVPRQESAQDVIDATDPPQQRKPAQQFQLPNGLRRFYHVHRWGVPLADGPVEALTGGASDDEADEDWRLEESLRRMQARPELPAPEIDLMRLWNAHVQALPTPLVSDRMLPDACRRFAHVHADSLRANAPLCSALREHLTVLQEHNLLHRDDVQDCLVIIQSVGEDQCCSSCGRPLHDRGCALAGRVRGAAAWPELLSNCDAISAAESHIRAGGIFGICNDADPAPGE